MRFLHAAAALGCLTLCLLIPLSARSAEDNTAFIVATNPVFDGLTGLRAYFKDAGVAVVHVSPEDMTPLDRAERCLVFGSPADQGPLGELIRAHLTARERKDAETMGKGVLTIKTVEGRETLFFVTAFGMGTFVKSHASEWKDIFEDWYYIAQSITSIIGY